MGDFEDKLASVMNNPEMMEKIMNLAQSMGSTPPPSQPEIPENPLPDMDISMLQKLSGFARQSGIDKNQQSLLQALTPYISQHRVARLERAMRAAKMAGFATSFLGR